MDETLNHPTLNCILRGRSSKSTTQFRNLKYASIPGRWQDSIPNETLATDSNAIFDATQFGPSCPQKCGAQAWDLTLVGDVKMPLGEGHSGPEEGMDEFECLSVNVTVPNSTMPEGGGRRGLSVFVWVHGGGLSMGSNSWPQYDLTKFVERSVEIGRPVIAVSINYRVGILGFLASREMDIDGNFGFKDQVLAFRWIKKHIEGFGGDPNNVTAAGESAGGISLSILLCAEVGDEALFERVVIMSGEATLRKPRNRAWHEVMYQDQIELIELEGLGIDERVKRAKECSVEEMIDKLPLAQHFCACVDGKFLKEDVNLVKMTDGRHKQHKPDWCKEFVIGDAAHDGTVFKGRILNKSDAFSLFKSLCAKHLTPSETSSLLAAYNLPASSPEQHQQSLLELVSELRFYLPTLAVHSGWKGSTPPKDCCRYYFHVPKPIEGAFLGLASHEFDVACLLQNFSDYLEDDLKEVGKQMADQWIHFANGAGWCEDGKLIVVGEEGVVEVDEVEYDMKFRGGRGHMLESIGAERLWKVAEAWQGVRAEESVSH